MDITKHHRHTWRTKADTERRQRNWAIVAFVFLFIAYGIVGTMDYNDQVNQHHTRGQK